MLRRNETEVDSGRQKIEIVVAFTLLNIVDGTEEKHRKGFLQT